MILQTKKVYFQLFLKPGVQVNEFLPICALCEISIAMHGIARYSSGPGLTGLDRICRGRQYVLVEPFSLFLMSRAQS